MNSSRTYKGLILFLLTFSAIFPLTASGKSEDSTGSVNSTDVTPGPGNGPMGRPEGAPPRGNPPQGMPMGMDAADLERQSHSVHFGDLDESTVSINAYVDYLYEKGLLADPDGSGLFRPEDILTRGELAFMLYGKYRYPAEGFSYGDVPTTEYYYQAVMRGKASGVFEDTKYFTADEGVTREQAALWIYRSELANGMPGEMVSHDVSAYTDGDTMSEEGQTAVGTLSRMGFFEPDGEGLFSPDREMTRTEIVSILYKLSFIGGGPGMIGGPGGGPGGAPGMMGGPGGSGNGVDHGSAAYTADTDITGEVFISAGDQENAVRVDGETGLLLKDITIEKNGGDAAAGDSSNFYGSNAAFLALNGAGVTLSHITVDSTADGGNGVFSYGEGTDVTLTQSVIRTSGNNSGGVMVTGGGAMTVDNCDVETQGRSSAALRTDRGGGTLTVKEGTYKAHGEGSPAVYCTAAITVEGADLTATSSEAFVVEGKNSLRVIDCDAQGNMQKQNVENYQNVMIYQSMSGDAETGRSSFTMKGGSLTSHNGDMIYVTNTACDITLENVELTLSDDVLLKVAGNDARNGWGVAGENGGDCHLLAVDQPMGGSIMVDGISTLEMVLSEGTIFRGVVNGEGEDGIVSVSLDGSSRWILTGDSHISSLAGGGENIDLNGYVLYIGDDIF